MQLRSKEDLAGPLERLGAPLDSLAHTQSRWCQSRGGVCVSLLLPSCPLLGGWSVMEGERHWGDFSVLTHGVSPVTWSAET